MAYNKHMRYSRNNRSAFTIVELLIVIVVIAILAVITIVAYNGAQTRARASAASQALSQAKKKLELYKVDAGNYPASAALASAGVSNSASVRFQYTATTNNSGYCLTATAGDVQYYLDTSTNAAPTQGYCTGHAWPGGATLTNIFTDGDFSSGSTAGWATEAQSTLAISGNVMISTSTGRTANIWVYKKLSETRIVSNKYYVKTSARVTNNVCTKLYISHIASNVILNPIADTWYSLSSVTQAFDTYSSFVVNHTYADIATSSGKVLEFKNVIAINLTAAFGAGNEPTKAQMDTIMQQFPNGWFNGTVTANTKGIL